MSQEFNNKTILITGGSGSWGNELTKQLLENYKPKQIIIFSRGELAQVNMKRKFHNFKNIKYVIGDIRDLERVTEATKDVDIIFHLAALKHVPICEENPDECIKTNIVGTKNVIESAKKNNVENVVYTSSDKACNPINIYGNSKSVGEKLIIEANTEKTKTKFCCIRLGNVIGSNGSIIPFFIDILKNSTKPLPITDIGMTRYFMSLSEAINLIFKATKTSMGGEIFVTKMPACHIIDLAEVLSNHYNREFNYTVIGTRPGEKLHEELVSEYEAINTVEDENFRIILSSHKEIIEKYKKYSKMKEKKYTSNDILINKTEIKNMLSNSGFLNG